MNIQQAQMNMANMGGPVQGAGTPKPAVNMTPEVIANNLNTAIYDYFLRNKMYELARGFFNHPAVHVQLREPKQSPTQRGGQQANGPEEDTLDSKDPGLMEKPDDLPLPRNLGNDGPFLQDWWAAFWETWNAHRQPQGTAGQYIMQQRNQQNNRMNIMNNLNQANANNMRGMNPMMQANGMMTNDLKRAAMQNRGNMNPQQLAQMQNMKAAAQNGQMMQGGNQMDRQGSQMDNRSGSPGSGDAPSPKRQRLDGSMQQMNQGRPGQPGQMQQGNQVGLKPPSPRSQAALESVRQKIKAKGEDPDKISQERLLHLSQQPANWQDQSVEVYSQSMQRQMQDAMKHVQTDSNVNKGMQPNMVPGGAQGSPMSQQGLDGATAEFYNQASNGPGRMPMQNTAAAVAAGQGNSNGNHALQDYQMQLMLLEQQNKKRLLMARQEQDNMQHPGGVGPNGMIPPGTSPQGSQRGGPSPNPNDMARGSPGNGMIDPSNIPPQMRQQMMMNPNGQMMRPPSSHPGGNFTQAQTDLMSRNMQMNGQFPPSQQPQGMMPGQPGQPGQGPQNTPRPGNMPPPPAPQANAAGTGPSSPSQAPAPPTPSTTAKGKAAGKKETAKKGATKKGAANATPATESERPPTPTPPTPATPAPPMNPLSFNPNAKNGPMTNGAAPGQPQPNAQAQNQQQPQPNANGAPQPPDAGLDQPFGTGLDDDPFANMGQDLTNVFDEDMLESFNFDEFIADQSMGATFDANFAFGDGLVGNGIEGGN